MAPPGLAGTPLVSIVIPTMNSEGVLAVALESLARQSSRDFEVIVSDGASRDATLAVASRWRDSLPSLLVDSRPDSGVYDAINRGVRLARGRWFLVLGSDDRLHAADTLARAAAALADESEAEIVHGDVRMMAANQSGVAPGGRYAGPMPLERLLKANLCQQAVFYRHSLFDRLGGFDLRYRLYADWDFNLRAAFELPMRWIDLIVADYAATGMSATSQDAAFIADLPAFARRELLRRRGERATWPAQRHLLRCANQFRKVGDWHRTGVYLGSYLRLLASRWTA